MVKSADVIRLLLETYGANPDVRDNAGRTPLSLAVCINYKKCYEHGDLEDIVKLLLDADADVNSQDQDGRTALHHAISPCFHIRPTQERKRITESIVQVLLDHGAAANIEDKAGRTPVSLAAQLHFGSTVGILLKSGAEADSPDNTGRTPLSYALDPQLMLEGAPKPFGTPKRTIEVLLANGASLTVEDKDGMTPLSRAEGHLPLGHEVLTLLAK